MHKRIVCCLLCFAVFASCSQKKNLIPDDYDQWERTEKEVLKYQIPGHDNDYREIYINEIGEKVIETVDRNGIGSYNYPEGTIIIKEIFKAQGYSENSKPYKLTCMVKDPKNPKARGGWVWVMKNLPKGDETVIDFAFCVTCHANANEPHPYGDKNPESEFRDYVFFPYKQEESAPSKLPENPSEY
jgi:hypothetical protein